MFSGAYSLNPVLVSALHYDIECIDNRLKPHRALPNSFRIKEKRLNIY